LQPMFLASAVTVELHASANLQAAVDAERFGQIVRNLLANALKFSPRNSQVEIHAIAESPNTIDIRIRDHGQGIPEAELALIFDRFRQGSNATGTRGVGLGLAISREFVVLHGGQLRVRNHVEGGAEFSFSIVAPMEPTGELPRDDV